MREGKTREAGGLLVLLLLGVFSVCILLVLLLGADNYRNLIQRDDASFDRRTAMQYIATKVRQADTAGTVTVGTFQGQDAVELRETMDGETYLTRIYCYDGSLRELYAADTDTLSPADGETVLPAQALTAKQEGRLLKLELTDETGTVFSFVLTLRSEEEVRP